MSFTDITTGLPREISTDPAMRAIGAMSRGQRQEFFELPDAREQEKKLVAGWQVTQCLAELATHNAERSAQAVDRILSGERNEQHVNRFFQLSLGNHDVVYPHEKDRENREHAAKQHRYLWTLENKFRYFINEIIERHLGEEGTLPQVTFGQPAENYIDYTKSIDGKIGQLLVVNTFDRSPAPQCVAEEKIFDAKLAGLPIASRYSFEFQPS